MFKKGYYAKLLKEFIELHVTTKRGTMHLIVSSFLRIVVFLMIPLTAAQIVDALERLDFNGTLIGIVLFALSAFGYVLGGHYSYWAYYINANTIHNNLQKKILEKVTEFDAGFTATIPRESLISTAFADVDEARRVPNFFSAAIMHIVGIVVNIVIICFVDPVIGLIAFGLLVVSIIIFVQHTKRRDYFRLAQREHADNISGLYSQIIDGYKEVQTLDMKDDLLEYLESSKESWRKYHNKQRVHRDLAAGVVPFIIGFGRIIIYLLCANLILKGEYTVATLVLVIGYYENITVRYDDICDAIDNISRSSMAIKRLHRLIYFKTPHMVEFGENDTDDIRGEVEFRNVNFVYDEPPKKAPDGTLLKTPPKKAAHFRDISFKIQPNTLTAIVGKFGAGKSTIFRLLLRLYKVTKGEILLDGESIYDYTKEVYATNVSIVSQKPFVFDMSIRDNLNMVNSDVKTQTKVCKLVGVHEDIMKLENGYDTILRRDAENLSAGQKQLLSLARTLLSKSEVLLFDEATASLDVATSEKVVKVLKKLKEDHTVIMITHKPELMRMADEILVIDGGKLVDKGSHKKLVKSSKIYRELQTKASN